MTIKEKIQQAEERGNNWLAKANEYDEKGQHAKALDCWEKGQHWLDRMNKLLGDS